MGTKPLLTDSTASSTHAGTAPIGLSKQPANTVLCGPASGSDAEPTMRALVASDIPPIAGSGDLLAANNLSDVANAATALANLAGAPLASPALTGTPTAPTASASDNSTKLATTAYADRAGVGAVASVFGRTGAVVKAGGDYAVADVTGAAPLASPTFTGTPAAPTAAVDTNTTQLATTAMVLAQAASATPAANGVAAVGTSTRYARGDHVHPTDTTLAPLASPALTGTPTAPTAAVDTNTTQIATTAMVLAQAASANPVMDGSVAVGTSTRYARADHVHASDTSRAPLASPALTGTPTAPTASAATNSTQVATTAYADAATGPAHAALTDGATITWATAGAKINNASVTLGGNRTLSITGAVDGASGLLLVKQPSSGGPDTLALPSGSKVAGGGAGVATLSTANNAVDALSWYYDGTNYWWTVVLNFS